MAEASASGMCRRRGPETAHGLGGAADVEREREVPAQGPGTAHALGAAADG